MLTLLLNRWPQHILLVLCLNDLVNKFQQTLVVRLSIIKSQELISYKKLAHYSNISTVVLLTFEGFLYPTLCV